MLHIKYLPRESDSVPLQRGTEINEGLTCAVNMNRNQHLHKNERSSAHLLLQDTKPAPSKIKPGCFALLRMQPLQPHQCHLQGRILQPPRPSSWSKGWCWVLKHEPSRPWAKRLSSRLETPPDPKSPSQGEAASVHCGLADTSRAAQSPELLERAELPCYGVNLPRRCHL